MQTKHTRPINILISTLALGLSACASSGGGLMKAKAIAAPTTPPAPAQNPFDRLRTARFFRGDSVAAP